MTDRTGHVILRITQPGKLGDDVSDVSVIRAALQGTDAASTEILSRKKLVNENNILGNQALINLVDTPKAKPTNKTEETSGMVLMAASPIIGDNGDVIGTLYGGHLLNRNFR